MVSAVKYLESKRQTEASIPSSAPADEPRFYHVVLSIAAAAILPANHPANHPAIVWRFHNLRLKLIGTWTCVGGIFNLTTSDSCYF